MALGQRCAPPRSRCGLHLRGVAAEQAGGLQRVRRQHGGQAAAGARAQLASQRGVSGHGIQRVGVQHQARAARQQRAAALRATAVPPPQPQTTVLAASWPRSPRQAAVRNISSGRAASQRGAGRSSRLQQTRARRRRPARRAPASSAAPVMPGAPPTTTQVAVAALVAGMRALRHAASQVVAPASQALAAAAACDMPSPSSQICAGVVAALGGEQARA